MKALTLKQPWAWAVAHAGKDVENRTWKPPASVIGQRIAIHAGCTPLDANDEEGLDAYEDIIIKFGIAAEDAPDDHPIVLRHHPVKRGRIWLGGIVAVATIAGWIKENGDWQTPGISGVSRETGNPFIVDRGLDSRWFAGPYGWLLAHVITLPKPIACRGAQGLWNVPADIEAEINKQLEVSHERDE